MSCLSQILLFCHPKCPPRIYRKKNWILIRKLLLSIWTLSKTKKAWLFEFKRIYHNKLSYVFNFFILYIVLTNIYSRVFFFLEEIRLILSHWTSLKKLQLTEFFMLKLVSNLNSTTLATKWNLICYPGKSILLPRLWILKQEKIRWDILLIIFFQKETICSDVINYSELFYFSIFSYFFFVSFSHCWRICTKSIINHKDVYKSKHMR